VGSFVKRGVFHLDVDCGITNGHVVRLDNTASLVNVDERTTVRW
jgi:hypothetical protein